MLGVYSSVFSWSFELAEAALRIMLNKIDASVKSTLPPRFWSVAGATARVDSWFLQRFSDFWRLHQNYGNSI